MSIFIGSSEIKNAYIGTTPVKEIFVGTTKVRPPILEYDFTTGNHGWTASSGLIRDSNGFYSTGTSSEQYIEAPAEVFTKGNPTKIVIQYNKTGASSGTGIGTSIYNYAYFVPARNDQLTYFRQIVNSVSTNLSLPNNTTGVCKWEMDIDSSTTNWTVVHKITGNSDITETSGALKYLFNNSYIRLRIVNWNNGGGMKIQKVTFKY